MIEKLEEAIQIKLDLADKMALQMQDDVKNKIISSMTIEKHYVAKESLEAAKLRVKAGNVKEALYFFSRGCWNLGEFMGRSRIEKEQAQIKAAQA